MKPQDAFTIKARKYAKYRWDYSDFAIHAIWNITGLGSDAVIADIGAGTGILTRHFIGKVAQIYAVEPNEAMRQIASETLNGHPNCRILNGCAEATGLADHSIDLITVATAFNWFEPQATKKEFERILRPGAWLARLNNYGTNQELGDAMAAIYPKSTDTEPIMPGRGTQMEFYYGGAPYKKLPFEFKNFESWDEFFGALCSASFAPDEDHPEYTAFESAAKRVFGRFSRNNRIEMDGITELCLGQLQVHRSSSPTPNF